MKIPLKKVREQVIVITGATSGIGLATARQAAKRGASVVLNARAEEDLLSIVSEIAENGGQAAYAAGDIADESVVRELAATAIREFGRVDTWVNNAGVSIYGLLEEVSIADARRLFDTNYWGMVQGSLVALQYLKSSGGALINVGSELSETVIPLQGHYNASKHALKGFTETLRIELEKEKAPVSVTLVEPSAIDTPYPEHAKSYMDVEPTHQPPVYAPEIVANAILHCASHSHRTVRVGAGAKAFTLIEKVVPAFGDRIKVASTFEGSRTDEPARDEDTLFDARPGDPRVRGNYKGHVMKQSWSTAATLRPVSALIAVATIGVGLAYAVKSWREN
ncbi:MAG: SDR family oxidoreductase [Gemmatimonadaceae bacterium]|nr:SDR family oxidoreductase [Gemmatimonadaceae bacterium]